VNTLVQRLRAELRFDRAASSNKASGTPRFFNAAISRAVGPKADFASSRRSPSLM
jgi:hypothetical protein